MTERRYAIYYAPQRDSDLDRFGRHWLARDACTGAPVQPPRIGDLDPERQREITKDARHYGFHGTLKPPFAMPEGRTAEQLHAEAEGFAAGCRAFDVPPLKLARISGFLALIPSADSPELASLAAGCVRAFDSFRAPPPPQELERRRRAGLSERQEEYLRRWGYPYVMDAFRFHLTLTCCLSDDEATSVARDLAPLVAPLCRAPLVVDSICVFEQETRAAPFLLTRRFPFGA